MNAVLISLIRPYARYVLMMLIQLGIQALARAISQKVSPEAARVGAVQTWQDGASLFADLPSRIKEFQAVEQQLAKQQSDEILKGQGKK